MFVEQQEPLFMTEAEYLQFEENSETKHEFVNGKVYAMAGASWRHNVICLNTGTTINRQLVDKPCTAVSSDIRVRVDAKVSHRYPDVVVVCGEPEFVDNRVDTISNPTLIVEVLSPSTALIDLNEKLHEYIRLPSLQEYILITQHEARIERYLRQEASEEWLYKQVSGLESHIYLPSIDCVLMLSDIYQKVTFESDHEN